MLSTLPVLPSCIYVFGTVSSLHPTFFSQFFYVSLVFLLRPVVSILGAVRKIPDDITCICMRARVPMEVLT